MNERHRSLTIHRLKKRADFLRASASSSKIVTTSLVLQSVSTPESVVDAENFLRVGFTASKKVGNAVMRNRAKRRLRAAVSDLFADYAAVNNDYVLIARKHVLQCPYDALLKDLRYALKKVQA